MRASQSFQKGVKAYQAGNTAEARRYLLQAVREQPDNDQAWAWLSNVAETREERCQWLHQVVKINPGNKTAAKALEALEGKDWAKAARSSILQKSRWPLPGFLVTLLGMLNDIGK